MISSQEALAHILACSIPFESEKVDLLKATGRLLKEPIFADRDFPPFDRVMMDGVALSIDRLKNGQREFHIENIQAAGAPQLKLIHPDQGIEVMTGAVLPLGTDLVIPYEKLSLLDGVAKLKDEPFSPTQHVHFQGTDQKKGAVLIEKNTVISSAEIGLLATVGKSRVAVVKPPKVLVISTGDELVNIDSTPAPHQIRKSNVYTLLALLSQMNISADQAHLTDNKAELIDKIGVYLTQYDCIICSGAVSRGKYDFLPEVFDTLGVQKQFHRVKQRPGKPFWFGTHKKCAVFAFPGNPVSTFVGALYYFKAWYFKGLEITPPLQLATLTSEVVFNPPLTYFLQVKITWDAGQCYATPIPGKGSGDLANLVYADAFMILPETKTNFSKGSNYPILYYR